MLPLPAGTPVRVLARRSSRAIADRDRWSFGRRRGFFVGDDWPRPTTLSTDWTSGERSASHRLPDGSQTPRRKTSPPGIRQGRSDRDS